MSEDRDLLDDVLDRALALHGRCEPRPGLESRVLATLRSRPPLPWWGELFGRRPAWVALGVLATAGGFAASLLLEMPRPRAIVPPPLASLPAPAAPEAVVETAPPPVPAVLAPPAPPERPRDVARLASVARRTRHSSFPRSAPLSEQERLLLRYVSEAPREEIEPRAGFLDAPAPLPALADPTTQP